MRNNGSFNYEELNTLYKGIQTAIMWIYADKEMGIEEKEMLSQEYRDILHKIELRREAIEDRNIKREIREFRRMGW